MEATEENSGKREHAVQTRVTKQRKETIKERMEELGFDSQADYLDAMEQAGYSKLDPSPRNGNNTGSQCQDLKTKILTELSDGNNMTDEELLEAVVGDLEETFSEALNELQEENKVGYDYNTGTMELKNE